jgi:hypothetical protein
MIIITGNESDPAFRYESLARFAFGNCYKYGDPWKCAKQEFYINFIPPNIVGKRGLSRALCKLIFDYRDKTSLEELKKLEDSIWIAKTQDEIIDIIDKTIEWIEKN